MTCHRSDARQRVGIPFRVEAQPGAGISSHVEARLGVGVPAHAEARRRGAAEKGLYWLPGSSVRRGSRLMAASPGVRHGFMRSCAFLLACALAMACAAAPPSPPGPPTTSGAGAEAQQETELLPAGYGTLHQDEVTVSLRSGPLLIKVTPLAESVTRLLAPDTYDRLHALAESRRAEAARAAMVRAELFLVSFFSYEQDVAFQPEDLQLTHQGKLMRSVQMLPITSGFGRQRLAQQENQTAIYVFDERIDYEQPIVVRYGVLESGDWAQIIPRLEVERAKVRARVR